MTNALVVTLIVGSIVLLLFVLYKVRKVHLMTFRLADQLRYLANEVHELSSVRLDIANLYNEYQAYDDLIRLIRPVMPLPLFRGWRASPDFLLEVCCYHLTHKPNIVLECSSGASTLVLARCCEINGIGHVYSLEHEPQFADQTRRQLRIQNLEQWATVIDAPLIEQPLVDNQKWYSLDDLQIDRHTCELLVIDGPPGDTAHQARYPALPMLSSLLSPECSIFLDDYHRTDEKAAVERWLKDFPALKLKQLQCEKGCAMLSSRLVR